MVAAGGKQERHLRSILDAFLVEQEIGGLTDREIGADLRFSAEED